MGYDDRDTMQRLVGRTITGYKVSDAKQRLTIETDKGPLVYQTYGDCCSHSWFEYVDELDGIIGHRVTETRHISLTDTIRVNDENVMRKLAGEEEDYNNELKFYGHKITTTGGTATIEFRNSSNGYYGGWMEEAV